MILAWGSFQHSTLKVSSHWSFRCPWPYLHFKKGLMRMFSSFRCAGMECKWRADRLCVCGVDWLGQSHHTWLAGRASRQQDLSNTGWAAVTGELKRWTADLPRSLGALGRGRLKARVRSEGISSVKAVGAGRRQGCHHCSWRPCYSPERAALPMAMNFQIQSLRTWGTGFPFGGVSSVNKRIALELDGSQTLS